MGISCVIYLLNLSGALDHPLAEVMICAVSILEQTNSFDVAFQTINLLPPAAPMVNFVCIRPYRSLAKIFLKY